MELCACFPTLMLPQVANPSRWAAGHLLISSFPNSLLRAGAYAGVWAHTGGLLSALSQVQHWARGWERGGESPAPHAHQEWAPESPTQEHHSFPALLPPTARAQIESPLLGRRVSHSPLPLGKLWPAQIYLATHGESRGCSDTKINLLLKPHIQRMRWAEFREVSFTLGKKNKTFLFLFVSCEVVSYLRLKMFKRMFSVQHYYSNTYFGKSAVSSKVITPKYPKEAVLLVFVAATFGAWGFIL